VHPRALKEAALVGLSRARAIALDPDPTCQRTQLSAIVATQQRSHSQLCHHVAEDTIDRFVARHRTRTHDSRTPTRHTPRGVPRGRIDLELNTTTRSDLANRSHAAIVRPPNALSAAPLMGHDARVGGSA